ncbi:MAG: DDE-type integrase/transposase/recombinase [Acidovorax sp.]|nr:DDE-type integrase/transposase/recombinase [Acidovorax sp.]
MAASRPLYPAPRRNLTKTVAKHNNSADWVQRLMQQNRLRPLWPAQILHTTDSGHALPVSANALARRFNLSDLNQAWVSDITYIHTRSGRLYLSVVLVLHARKIVDWAWRQPCMRSCCVQRCNSPLRSVSRRRRLIAHSDRGSQYTSALHQTLLARHSLVCSMSRKGNCWNNAVMERLFLSLKTERVWQHDYANHAGTMTKIATTSWASTTACGCTQNRTTCRPMKELRAQTQHQLAVRPSGILGPSVQKILNRFQGQSEQKNNSSPSDCRHSPVGYL